MKFNGGKTNFVLSHWLNTNKDIQFSPEQFGIKPAIKPSDAQGIIRKALENDGMWHISSDGQTATLHMDRRKVFTSDGKEVILNIAPIGEVYNEYKQKSNSKRQRVFQVQRYGLKELWTSSNTSDGSTISITVVRRI